MSTDPVDLVRAQLAALPEIPMPPDVADRIGAALDGERGRSHPARRRAVRRIVPLTCAASVLTALVVTLTFSGPAPQPVGREDDLRSAGTVAFGRDGAGTLADPVRRTDCLTAAGVPDPGAALLGGAPHAVDGTPGTLLLLGTDVTGRYRVVVVDAGCSRVLAQAVVGR